MRNVMLGLVLLSSTAFAAGKSATGPVGTGNFRRAAALAAAGVKDVKTARVVGMAIARRDMKAPADPTGARTLLVEHGPANDRLVTLVKAPLDLSKRVTRMTQKEANAEGLKTQNQAMKLASVNGGELGTEGKVQLTRAGIGSRRGSYVFNQVAPTGFSVKSYGSTYTASNVTREVSITGKAESASASLTSPATK